MPFEQLKSSAQEAEERVEQGLAPESPEPAQKQEEDSRTQFEEQVAQRKQEDEAKIQEIRESLGLKQGDQATQKPEPIESDFEDTFRQYMDSAKEFDTTKGETFKFIHDMINNGKVLELVGVAEGSLGKFKYEHERGKFQEAAFDALLNADVPANLSRARDILKAMDKSVEPVSAYQRQLINKYLEGGDLRNDKKK